MLIRWAIETTEFKYESNHFNFILTHNRGSYIGWRANDWRRENAHNGRYDHSIIDLGKKKKDSFITTITARRRVAAKRKKLKNLGKSKSTDTEDEDADEDCGDEG